MELGESEMNSDSDSSGTTGLMDFNLDCGFESDLGNQNCFPDLHDGIGNIISLYIVINR